jgi:flagellar biosynthesis/type III secretory pathway M-ring protein FliF/YscJ
MTKTWGDFTGVYIFAGIGFILVLFYALYVHVRNVYVKDENTDEDDDEDAEEDTDENEDEDKQAAEDSLRYSSVSELRKIRKQQSRKEAPSNAINKIEKSVSDKYSQWTK